MVVCMCVCVGTCVCVGAYVCVCGHWYWFSRSPTLYPLGHMAMSFLNVRLLGRCRHSRKGQDEKHETSNSGKQPRAEIPRANWQATKHNHRKMKWQSTMTEKHEQQHQGAHNSDTWREFQNTTRRSSLFAKMSRGGQFLKPSISNAESNAEKQTLHGQKRPMVAMCLEEFGPRFHKRFCWAQLLSCVLFSAPISC